VAASHGPPYRITFTIEMADFVAASRLMRRRPMLGGILFGVVAIGVGAATVLITDSIAAGVLAVVGGLVGVIVFGTGLLDRRMAAQETRSFLGMPVSMAIGVDGVESSSAAGSSLLPWSAVTHVLANARVIVLMRDQVAMAWLPTSAFASAPERDAAVGFMQAQVASHARALAERPIGSIPR
jgi:hypothetical protein